MKTTKRSIACFCENVFEAEIPEVVDLSAEPAVADVVLAGDFMSVPCPLCGKRLSPEFPCLFSSAQGDNDIWLIPETDRVAFMLGKLPYDIGAPWRVAVGFRELAEKLRAIRAGLDDRVIEIMKYYLITRPRPSAPGGEGAGDEDAAEADVGVIFGGEEGGKLVFHVSGLKAGEIGVARLGMDVYHKVAADVDRRIRTDPFKEFCIPPHVSVRRISSPDDAP
jgi:hypothetical protein